MPLSAPSINIAHPPTLSRKCQTEGPRVEQSADFAPATELVALAAVAGSLVRVDVSLAVVLRIDLADPFDYARFVRRTNLLTTLH